MDQGDALVSEKNYTAALEKYRAADAIMHVPTTGIEVARTLAALGRLSEAREAALLVLRSPRTDDEPGVFVTARKDATDLVEALLKRIPTLEIEIHGVPVGTRVELVVDRKPVASGRTIENLEVGWHRVDASAEGYRPVSKRIELAEGQHESVELLLRPISTSPKPIPEPARSSTSPLVYIGFGVGGVGLLVGSASGLWSLKKVSDAEDRCDGDRCPPSAREDIDSARTFGTISTIGFAVAVAGAGVGVYGLLNPTKIQPVVGARYVGVRSVF
jgi:hypothetical protein